MVSAPNIAHILWVEPLIKIRDLHVWLAGQEVLKGVNLDIFQGEVLTLIGESGAGKSVLVKTLIGLLPIHQGSIDFDGQDLSQLEDEAWTSVRRRIGMLFQESALFDSMSVYANVAYALHEQRTMPEDQIAQRVSTSLESVSLPGIEHMLPRDLSGGMQKRVALARAIAMHPEVVIYDEPTEGLDPINVTRVNRLMLNLRDRLQTTTIIVTHNMQSTFQISDRIALLHEGDVALVGTPDALRAQSQDPRLRAFVASSEVRLRAQP